MNSKKEIRIMNPEYCINIGCRKLDEIDRDPYAYAGVLEKLQRALSGNRRMTFEDEINSIAEIDSAIHSVLDHPDGSCNVQCNGREIEIGCDCDGILVVVKEGGTVVVDCVDI